MIRSLLLPSLLFLGACASSGTPTGTHVGEALETRAVHQLEALHQNPDNYFDQTLWVEADVVAVCQKMGCWMQVQDGDSTSLVRWESGCGGKYEFPKDAVGERILIQGSFYAKELSEADREHMQEEAGEAVAIPERTFEMNASAVVLLDRDAG